MVDDDLWALIEPLLPPWPEKAPGPRPVPDRQCLQGILYALHNDIAWQLLPLELGFGSGQTCWRRLERWQQAGVFDRCCHVIGDVVTCGQERTVAFCCSGGGGCAGSA
ncbi:transposase, partial [Streptomyces cinereoruber]|uniref:transposase n=1 Tax=Streptomyces cinereoruber TaxID=67260 RepID=UPI003652CC5B